MSIALTVALAYVAILYLRGSRHVAQPWRVASFLAGLICTWIAVASPFARFDGQMLTAHMIQHLLLMTFAPPLIWLGAPVRPLLYKLRSLPVAARFEALQALLGIGAVLSNPVVCWLSAAAALVVWHVPALLRLGMESPAWHFVEHISFLAAGLLFWWPVIQPWPSVPRWPRWSMLLYLFLATLPCDVLAGLLVFSDRLAYPVYLCTPHRAGFSALEDQQCAGALMWTCVTVVFLVAGTILATQLLSPRIAREVVQV
jgi:cytochrome c oxidase assembly factor CtaG